MDEIDDYQTTTNITQSMVDGIIHKINGSGHWGASVLLPGFAINW